MREQTGALAPPSSDENKVRHSRRQGIMASVFSGTRPHIHEVNLDLSVEMNRKMQSVLEDTLLKNITLKVGSIWNTYTQCFYCLYRRVLIHWDKRYRDCLRNCRPSSLPPDSTLIIPSTLSLLVLIFMSELFICPIEFHWSL